MKQEDLFRKLGLILNELNEQYQFLAQNPQQLNELELELFQANAKFLTDHIQIIKKINLQAAPLVLPSADDATNSPATPVIVSDGFHDDSQVEQITFSQKNDEIFEDVSEATVPELQNEEPPFSDIEQEVFKLDSSPASFEFILNDHSEHEKFEFEEEKSVDSLFNRPLSEEEERILAQKIQLREQAAAESADQDDDEIGPEPFLVTKEPEFPIEMEDLTLEVSPPSATAVNTKEPVEDPSYKPTLNDILARSNKANVNSTAQGEIKDLKQAISLNDKLLYIKDLFNGYNLAYTEAIDVANKLPNFEAADAYFQKTYASKNNWAAKQATVEKFYGLLSKRWGR